MKKLLLGLITLFTLTGCSLFKDNLDGATIYTTTYPIKYLVETLYGDYAQIESIYPADADVYTYKLTDKQNNEYAKSDLFIYNGKSNEKTVAKDLINKNGKLLIIDVANGLTYTYGVEELWMSPNNYLMLAKNIRDNLTEYLKSRAIIDTINQKYNAFAETISLMDADLRTIGKEAKEKGKNTIVVTDDLYKYLTNYGFEVISLDEDSVNETTLSNVEAAFKNGTYKALIVSDNKKSEAVDKMITDDKIEVINISTMTNNSNAEDYLSTMQMFIDNIRNLTLSD